MRARGKRYGVDHDGCAAGTFQVKTEFFKEFFVGGNEFDHGTRQFDGFRKQQLLSAGIAAVELIKYFLKHDAFMGGMLINENESVGTFREDVGAVDGTDDPEWPDTSESRRRDRFDHRREPGDFLNGYVILNRFMRDGDIFAKRFFFNGS